MMAERSQSAEPPTLDQVRAGVSAAHRTLCPPVRHRVAVADVIVPGPNGDVPCLVNTPIDGEGPLPIVVYYHGGGLMLLGADEYQPLCSAIAEEATCIVVNVDYRLAPEYPFPTPLDDAGAVYRWCRQHGDRLGGDTSRVAVAGDSAGGYLATAVCLDAREESWPQPTHQLLIYPAVDAADRSESMLTIDAYINFEMLSDMHAAHHRGEPCHPRVSPIYADDHCGLAPATIVAASHDPLVDQGRAYAAALRRSGVPVTYRRYDGTIHAFVTMGAVVDVANQAVDDIAADLRTVLG